MSTIFYRTEGKSSMMKWHLSRDLNGRFLYIGLQKRAIWVMIVQGQRPRGGSLLGAFKEHLDHLGGKYGTTK